MNFKMYQINDFNLIFMFTQTMFTVFSYFLDFVLNDGFSGFTMIFISFLFLSNFDK